MARYLLTRSEHHLACVEATLSYGRRDPESLEQLRATFAKEQIPLEFLSHYELE